VNGVVKEQKQPVAHGCVELQVPPQAKPLVSVCNWRAETVPAHRTAAAIAARIVFLVVLLMILSLFPVTDQIPDTGAIFSYFTTDAPGMGCAEQNGVPVSMGKMQRQP
jgi:hypothetical protein